MKKNQISAVIPFEINSFTGYVVGIGASAGGLDALEKFFDFCPVDTGATFVVIQHLSPDHKSMMSNLLARHTTMPVCMVEQNTSIEPNNVYLIPPGSIMHMGKGFLHLTPKNPRGLTLPIDIFFTSLAESYGNHAIGIVLSGTGSDGTRGASAINSMGGFLLAQEPSTAGFDGMPKSFINTGLIDAILPPEELANRVVAHINHLASNEPEIYVENDAFIPRLALSHEEAFNAIMQLLLQISGIDFKDYKPSTIMRRLERRMQVRRVSTLEDYLKLLETENSEIFTLRQEFLISVTSFFRDTEPFKTLTECAVAEIVASKNNGDIVRIWTAGCSTGEEPYTLGMLFIEEFERQKRWLTLKIFATDVNQQNIEFSAIGSYSESIAAELSPARLERFFDVKGSNFVVKNDLRQCIIFARHNLLSDPPFTKTDLVVCRNTLIYFKNPAQERALRRLQYAVNPQGFLFLGSSESLSGANEGFKTINAKHKLFKRITSATPVPYDMLQNVSTAYQTGRHASSVLVSQKAKSVDGNAIDSAISMMLNSYAPPALIVNGNHEILHFFGDVQPYLSFREGSASLQIGRVLPQRLIPIASALLYKAAKSTEILISDLIQFKQADDSIKLIRLSARQISLKTHEPFILLCFETITNNVAEIETKAFNLDAETIERIEILENELAATRESLQATIEELETSNEELQATNEELMASNEELQSSNEELQSVNEELNTVNAEYQEKAGILSQLNADLDSMAKASGVATIFVDEELRLTRFSQDAMQIFKLRNSDIGRRLDDFAHTLKYEHLIEDIEATLQLQRMTEREILSNDGRTFLVRILPYFVPSTMSKGVVASFVDITSYHDVQRLQSIIDALPEHIAVLEHDGKIAMINQAWQRFAKANGDTNLTHTGIGTNYFEACKVSNLENSEIAQRAIHGVKSVLEGSNAEFSLQYPCHSPTENRWFVMNVAPIKGYDYGAVVSHINISSWYASNEKKEAERE
ncbi:MAG: chemotaxis protein CheB [Methylococcales bacterium]|nr:chemotaxis protein CheB [Methylococcales bacterium]